MNGCFMPSDFVLSGCTCLTDRQTDFDSKSQLHGKTIQRGTPNRLAHILRHITGFFLTIKGARGKKRELLNNMMKNRTYRSTFN